MDPYWRPAIGFHVAGGRSDSDAYPNPAGAHRALKIDKRYGKISKKMTEASDEAVLEGDKEQLSLSDALDRLSLTTELDSALLNHLSLLDEYMFHVECLSQLFRMVLS